MPAIEPADAYTAAARVAAAETASRAKEWRRAAALWDALRIEAPSDARHWAKAAEAYCEAGLLDSADQLLVKALGLFPGDAWLAFFYLRVARRRQDWAEFLGRAEKLWTDFPDFWRGWIEFADALSVAGRKADAEARRREATQRFPTEFWPNFWVAWRRIAEPRCGRRGRDLVGTGASLPRTARRGHRPRCGTRSLRRGRADFERQSLARDVAPVSDDEYRCPTDLAIVSTPLRRVMVIGSCLSASWPAVLEGRHDGCTAEHFLINHRATLPADMPGAAAEYDFHLIQIPLRQLLNEHTYFGLPYSDATAFERLFDAVCGRLTDMLHDLMRWNRAHGVLTFVCNFLVPQQNPMGRLLPRYDLRNFVYFIEKLNEALGRELQQYENAYLFDFDQIVGTYGRRYVQDDAVWTLSHGAGLTDTGFEQDTSRLDPLERIPRYYPLSTHKIVQHACAELVAMYRTIRQDDMVKLVLVDLDDTLWRGVAAEEAEASSLWREGWPIGFVEALMFLKQRGVLLGIVSKNDEDRVRAMWQRIYGDLIQLEEFAVRKINWQPKADNIEVILRE